MIRTLIEITAETTWDFEKQLKDTLEKLGYEPKDDPDYVQWKHDLFRELEDRGLKPLELVEAQRAKRERAA